MWWRWLDQLVRTEAVAAPGPTTYITVFRERLGQGATEAGQNTASADVIQWAKMTVVSTAGGDRSTRL